MTSWNCQFVFYGADDQEALCDRIIAALKVAGLDFDPMTVEVDKIDNVGVSDNA